MEYPLIVTLGARMSAYLSSSEDYHKQRKRLNKRLLKLRHELDLITPDTKDYKKKEKISKISSSDYDQDEKYGLLLLLTAERDSLYSSEIKSLLEISNDNASSYRNLMISRIKKSLSSSKKLLEITVNEKDEYKRIEYYTYAALIQGNLSVNKKQWSKALNAFSIAKCALDFLYSQEDSKMDIEEEQEESTQFKKTLISEITETLVDPSLALAISQDDTAYSTTTDLKTVSRQHCRDNKLSYLQPVIEIIARIDPEAVSEVSSSTELIKSVQWRDHEATLYNDELAYKIMKLTNDNETNWKNFNDANQFDVLLSGWSELLEIHTNDMDKNKDEDDLEKVQDRAIVLTYINFNLLFTRLKRDLLIIDQLSSQGDNVFALKKLEFNKDIIRLYGTIITTTQEIKDLPGVYNDEDLHESLDNLEKFFVAKKSAVLARSFALNNKFPEALKIFDHVDNTLSSSDNKFYKIDEFPYNVSSNVEFEKFKKELPSQVLQAQILAQFSVDLSKNLNQSNFVIENMNKYPVSNETLDNIANFNKNLSIAPVLSKPVLFDIGFNYINYGMGRSSSYNNSNSATSTTSDSTTDQNDPNKKKSGFFGIFGRS
ncbi:DEHA2F02354p [Debaryomyces hansenii CBS767]|nr:DEHA2F02354p [Debaryomyces hansenii CBS767]CAG88773.2 DEHA2F02354p [Debaryomyces hansenii CBS767]|eukprot:XP_460466.2 DEHA2F02354p [Debaryomyces hansenii CBS767]